MCAHLQRRITYSSNHQGAALRQDEGLASMVAVVAMLPCLTISRRTFASAATPAPSRAALVVCTPTDCQTTTTSTPEVPVHDDWVISPIRPDTHSEYWCETIRVVGTLAYFASIGAWGITPFCRPWVRHRRIHSTTAANFPNPSIRVESAAKCTRQLA